MTLGFRFHHLGLAVRKPDRSRTFLEAQGYRIGEVVHDPLQKVNLILCTSDRAPAVELIYPHDGASPIDAILKRFDSGIYHMCYEADGVDAVESALRECGLKAMRVSDPKPAVLFGGRHVAFYNVIGVGVTEFLFPE